MENGKFGKKQDKEREMYHYLLSSGFTRTLLVKGKWNQRSKLLNRKKKNATAKEKNKEEELLVYRTYRAAILEEDADRWQDDGQENLTKSGSICAPVCLSFPHLVLSPRKKLHQKLSIASRQEHSIHQQTDLEQTL